jgi:hypothetical protein
MSIKQILHIITVSLIFVSCYKALYTKVYLIGEPPKKIASVFDGEKVIQDVFGWDVYVGFCGVFMNPSRTEASRDSFFLKIDCVPQLGESVLSKISVDSVQLHLLKSNTLISPTRYSHYVVKGSESNVFQDVYICQNEPTVELTFVVTVVQPTGEKNTQRKTVTMKRYERVEHGWIVD